MKVSYVTAIGPQMKAPDIDYSDVRLAQPWSGFSRIDIGPYVIGIAVTDENGKQNQEEAGAALEEFVRRAREALSKQQLSEMWPDPNLDDPHCERWARRMKRKTEGDPAE